MVNVRVGAIENFRRIVDPPKAPPSTFVPVGRRDPIGVLKLLYPTKMACPI
jgi:hypothetical protein